MRRNLQLLPSKCPKFPFDQLHPFSQVNQEQAIRIRSNVCLPSKRKSCKSSSNSVVNKAEPSVSQALFLNPVNLPNPLHNLFQITDERLACYSA